MQLRQVFAQRSALSAQLARSSIQELPVEVSTLNAYGWRLLRERVTHEGKPLIQSAHALRLMADLRKQLQNTSPERHSLLPSTLRNRVYLQFFSVLKNVLLDPRESNTQSIADHILATQARVFDINPQDPVSTRGIVQALIWLYREYEAALQRNNLMDYDDQKLRAYQALAGDSSLRASVQGRLSEVLVDEFQDINLLDFELIKLLAERADLVVCGDDDQAIYGFRGCTSDYIIDLEKQLGREVHSYELRTNYRCPPNIVEHATRLIRFNTRRIEKNPIAAQTTPSKIKVISSVSAAIEGRLIHKMIRRIRGSAPVGFDDFAVLYRTNAQSLPLQIEFVLNDIPYSVRDEDNILRNEELEKLLGVLRLKSAIERHEPPQPRDGVLAVRSYFRFVSPREQQQVLRALQGTHDFTAAIQSRSFFQALPKAERSNFPTSMAAVLDTRNLADTLTILGARFPGLQGMVGSLEDAVEERVPLGELIEVGRLFRGSTDDFVETIQRALTRARGTNAGKDENGVALRTFFRAKGLQWHTVFVMSCNEGLVPHRRAPIEDERRLFYVAMTRASANLFISHVKTVCGNPVPPSRFLAEAGIT